MFGLPMKKVRADYYMDANGKFWAARHPWDLLQRKALTPQEVQNVLFDRRVEIPAVQVTPGQGGGAGGSCVVYVRCAGGDFSGGNGGRGDVRIEIKGGGGGGGGPYLPPLPQRGNAAP